MTLTEVINNIERLPPYTIKIGVFDDSIERKSEDGGKDGDFTEIAEVGINNAQLMFIHENGSETNNIPARPVLKLTIEWANKTGIVKGAMSKALQEYIRTGFDISALEKELERLCVRLEDHAREIIYANDGQLIKNAPRTVKKKGFNHPLFETGQLARSITCRLSK